MNNERRFKIFLLIKGILLWGFTSILLSFFGGIFYSLVFSLFMSIMFSFRLYIILIDRIRELDKLETMCVRDYE